MGLAFAEGRIVAHDYQLVTVMADAGERKPVCQYCGMPQVVVQKTINGVLYYVHPWHVAVLTQRIENGLPIYRPPPA